MALGRMGKRGSLLRKVYCDHCGCDITNKRINDLTWEDCFSLDGNLIGDGAELCDECYNERERLHAKLDFRFLKMGG